MHDSDARELNVGTFKKWLKGSSDMIKAASPLLRLGLEMGRCHDVLVRAQRLNFALLNLTQRQMKENVRVQIKKH